MDWGGVALLHIVHVNTVKAYNVECVETKVKFCGVRRPAGRDEPGSGGVRVGQTRSDLDCRVVATS
jgi:hypothetical protein